MPNQPPISSSSEHSAPPGEREIQSLFNRIAPVYDSMNSWLSLGQHRVWKKMAVKWAEPQEGDRALDLCCGSGDLAFLLTKAVGETGQVTGVDFSCELLAIARQRSSHNSHLSWVEADVLHLPFAEASFDCATMGYGLRNVQSIPQALKELHRVLTPGAKAAILDFHRPYGALTQSFQQWYLDTLVVPTAQHFGLESEYKYIVPSLERFPNGRAQVKLAQEAGFIESVHYPIAGGMMGVLVVTKG